MGSCGDDQRQPPRCGQFCSSGCTHCRHVTPCVGVADPRGPSRTHLAVVLQRLVRATDPKFRRGHAPVIPYVRTAAPWIRRRRIPPSSCHSLRADNQARASSRTHLAVVLQGLVRATDPKVRRGHAPVAPCVRTAAPWIRRQRTLPSSCHSLRADNRARASSRTHLSRRVRPPRVQTAHLSASSSPGHPHPAGRHLRRGHSTRPGACPSGRGHSTPSGTAIPSPNASPVPGRTEMSPHAQDVPNRGT